MLETHKKCYQFKSQIGRSLVSGSLFADAGGISLKRKVSRCNVGVSHEDNLPRVGLSFPTCTKRILLKAVSKDNFISVQFLHHNYGKLMFFY